MSIHHELKPFLASKFHQFIFRPDPRVREDVKVAAGSSAQKYSRNTDYWTAIREAAIRDLEQAEDSSELEKAIQGLEKLVPHHGEADLLRVCKFVSKSDVIHDYNGDEDIVISFDILYQRLLICSIKRRQKLLNKRSVSEFVRKNFRLKRILYFLITVKWIWIFWTSVSMMSWRTFLFNPNRTMSRSDDRSRSRTGCRRQRLSYPAAMRTALAALALVVAVGGAQADPKPSDAAMMQRVLKRIEQDNGACNVGMAYAGRIAANGGAASARFDGALVLVYSVDGCNGGNNWGYTAQVYGVKGDTAVEIGKPQSWSIVKGADFNDKRAVIYAVSQGPGDAHCCPTEGKTIEVTVNDGQAVFRQSKAWHNNG